MTTKDQLEFIRQKCIEANPALKERSDHCYRIRLADVLLAIVKAEAKKLGDKYSGIPICEKQFALVIRRWNLRKDSLSDQSLETSEFIYELLKNV